MAKKIQRKAKASNGGKVVQLPRRPEASDNPDVYGSDPLGAARRAVDELACSPRLWDREIARLLEAALACDSPKALQVARLRLELAAEGRPYDMFSPRDIPENAGIDERLHLADRYITEAAGPLPERIGGPALERVVCVCEAAWVAGKHGTTSSFSGAGWPPRNAIWRSGSRTRKRRSSARRSVEISSRGRAPSRYYGSSDCQRAIAFAAPGAGARRPSSLPRRNP